MHRSAVQLDEVSDDREPEPEPAVLTACGRIPLTEPLEHVREKIRLDSGSIVGYADLHAAGFDLTQLHRDRAAALRELHSVRQEIPDHLLEPLRITVDESRRIREAGREPDVLRRGCRTNGIERRADHRPQIHWTCVEPQTTGDDAGHVEDVGNQLGLQLRVPVDDFQRVPAAARVHAAVQQHPRPADDRIQWRPQFVRQRGQELVLRPVGRFRFPACARFARQQLLAFTFCVYARGEIPYESGERRRIVVRHPRDRDFDRELPPFGRGRRGFHPSIDERAGARSQVSSQTLAVPLAQSRWNQDVREIASNHLGAGVAEHAYSRRVEFRDFARVRHADHGVERRVDDSRRAPLLLCDRVLLALPSDELTDLVPDGRHRPQQVRIWRDDGSIEAFDHAECFVAEADREAERAVEALLTRDVCTRKVDILYDVLDPCGPAAREHAPRQPDA